MLFDSHICFLVPTRFLAGAPLRRPGLARAPALVQRFIGYRVITCRREMVGVGPKGRLTLNVEHLRARLG